MRFHVRGVDHLCVCGSSVSSKLPEQVFPDATPRPAHKAIIDRCRRSILGRAIAPATAAFQNMHDAADDAAVVRPLDAPYIRRQMRFDPSPLLVAQPKQVPAHNPDPLPTTNQDRIVRAKKLMSSDPSARRRRRRIACRLTVTYAGFEGESALLEELYRRGLQQPQVAPDLYAGDGAAHVLEPRSRSHRGKPTAWRRADAPRPATEPISPND